MHLRSPNLAYKCSTMSPGNLFLGVKGQNHESQKHCRRGLCTLVSAGFSLSSVSSCCFLHLRISCFLVVTVYAFIYATYGLKLRKPDMRIGFCHPTHIHSVIHVVCSSLNILVYCIETADTVIEQSPLNQQKRRLVFLHRTCYQMSVVQWRTGAFIHRCLPHTGS